MVTQAFNGQTVGICLADVTHLRDVYKYLKKQLEEKGRSHWVEDEMATLSSIDTYRNDPAKAWQRMKLRVRKPRDLAVLKELAFWRETEAQNEILLEIVSLKMTPSMKFRHKSHKQRKP